MSCIPPEEEEETEPCEEDFVEKEDGVPSIMDEFGAPCSADADCVPILGEDAFCVLNILGVFDFPGGFCTTPCDVPDGETFVVDSEQCRAGGGVDCVGIQGSFTACTIPCSEHSECGRQGYGCVIMPLIASEGDPTYCLMNQEACCTDPGSC